MSVVEGLYSVITASGSDISPLSARTAKSAEGVPSWDVRIGSVKRQCSNVPCGGPHESFSRNY